MPPTTSSESPFAALLAAARGYPQAMAPSTLHGFLTGMALGPDEGFDAPWLETALGLPEITARENLLAEIAGDTVDEIVDAFLLDDEFELRVETDPAEGQRQDLWCRGFVEAVKLAEAAWKERIEADIELGRQMVLINIIADPQRYAPILFAPSVDIQSPSFIAEIRAMAAPLVNAMARKVLLDEVFPDLDEEYEDAWREQFSAMDFSADELATLTDAELMALLTGMRDTLPRGAVDECVRRAPAMLPVLAGYLADDENWGADVPTERWWALLHCILILGAMQGEQAGAALLGVFPRMQEYPEDDLWDWVAEGWPALFRGKGEQCLHGLRDIAADRSYDWYPRVIALESAVALAHAVGRTELEQTLDWAATFAADETEEEYLRYAASQRLLDQPRKRHRPLLLKMGRAQDLTREDIEAAFEAGDSPQWERFPDPWSFYDPDAIAERQMQWALEAAGDYEPPLDVDYGEVETYVREQPKIGRNDPCPCGSGKKYKKCCMEEK
jgi:yecA family protein